MSVERKGKFSAVISHDSSSWITPPPVLGLRIELLGSKVRPEYHLARISPEATRPFTGIGNPKSCCAAYRGLGRGQIQRNILSTTLKPFRQLFS
jgi:hypothetical protein